MLTFGFLPVFLNALQYLDLNLSVIDADAEEFLFLLLKIRLTFLSLADVLSSLGFGFYLTCFLDVMVVSLFEIGGADISWGLDVLATTLQHLDVVHPHLRVLDLVAVAVGYLDGVPIGVDVHLVGWSCT